MSAHPSDSEENSTRLSQGWAYVNAHGDVESDKESSSSMEFVNLEDDIVSFHREKSASDENDCSGVSAPLDSVRDGAEQEVKDKPSPTLVAQPEHSEPSGSFPAAGPTDDHSDEESEPEVILPNEDTSDVSGSSDAVSFGLVDDQTTATSHHVEDLLLDDMDEAVRSADQLRDQGEDSGLDSTSRNDESLNLSTDGSIPKDQSRNATPSTEILPEVPVSVAENPRAVDGASNYAQQVSEDRTEMENLIEDQRNSTESDVIAIGNSEQDLCDSEFDANLEYESDMELEESRLDEIHENVSVLSGSDASDFVKLDVQGDEHLLEQPAVMETSGSSHTSSSISANFSFLRPYPRLVHIDSDDDTVPDDVDDRTESDQSVGGHDDDDSDLSSLAYGLGDTPLDDGRQVIIYRHHPNQDLNSQLTWVAVISLMLALGTGIGHFMGSVKEGSLRFQQVMKLREMQDEYLMCMRQQDFIDTVHSKLTQNIKELEDEVLAWKQKFQEVENSSLQGEPSLQELNKLQMKITKVTNLNEEMETLKSEHHTSTIINHQVEPEMELRKTIGHLEHEISAMQADKEVQKKSYQSLKERLDKVQIENKELKEEVNLSQSQKQHANHGERDISPEVKRTVNDLTNENRDLKKEVVKLRYSDHPASEEKHKSSFDLKNQVNILTNENQDLKSTVGKLRYSQVKVEDIRENKDENIIIQNQGLEGSVEMMRNVRDRLNQLANENEDLKQTVQNLRYGLPALRTPEDSQQSVTDDSLLPDEEVVRLKEKLMEIKKQLHMERVHSQMWQTVHVNKQTRNQGQLNADTDGTVPGFITCMSILAPTLNWTEFIHLGDNSYMQNTKEILKLHLAFFKNISLDSEYTVTLTKKWSEFMKYVSSSDFSDYTESAQAAYEDLQKSIWKKWESFQQEYDKMDDFAESMKQKIIYMAKSIKTKASSVKDWSGRDAFVQSYYEKSRDTVAKVGEKIHKTWDHIKGMSSEFLTEQKPRLEKLQKDVVARFSKISDKISRNLDKVKNTLQKKHKGWIQKQKKRRKNDKTENPKKTDKKKEKFGKRQKNKNRDEEFDIHPHSHKKSKKYQPKDEEFDIHPHSHKKSKKYQPKRDLPKYQKQKHRRHSRRTEDDMESAGQDRKVKVILSPDQILDETMFGDGSYNHQKKTRKRFHKLYDRIQGYDEQVIQDMDDDDDIDDLYDDLEEFQHDVQDEDYQGGLLTWLTCQLRWWKSRLHRKNRNEDILDGCGRHLMQFQIHTICGPPRQRGKCGHMTNVKRSPRCEDSYLYKYQNYRKSFKNCHKQKCQKKYRFKKDKRYKKSRKSKRDRKSSSDADNFHMKNDEHKFTAERAESNLYALEGLESQNNGSDLYNYMNDPPPADWFSRRMEHREDGRHSAQWYFDRAEDREDHHHDSLWYIKAVEENRKIENNPEWFLNRMRETSNDHESNWFFEHNYNADQMAP